MNKSTIDMISFNCKSLKRAVHQVSRLCDQADLVALQETWLLPHDLNFVHKVNSDFECVATSSVDTSVGVLRGRPYGGLALMWRKSRLPNVTVVECFNNRLIAIRVSTGKSSFLVFSVYLPVDNNDNLPEFTDCLARLSAIIEESDVSAVYILGDFNAHPDASFGRELLSFCQEQKLVCADIDILGVDSGTYTYISDAHGSKRWLDHCVTTKSARNTIRAANVMYDVYTSDHYPLRISCDISDMCVQKSNRGIKHVNKILWGGRNASQVDEYYKYCNCMLQNLNDQLFCVNCENNEFCNRLNDHCRFIDKLYCDIVHILQSGAIQTADSRFRGSGQQRKIKGWNYLVAEHHLIAKQYFKCWEAAGRPSTGQVYERMRESKKLFKNKIKWCQRNQEMIEMDILASHHKNKNFPKFWCNVKKFNSKAGLPVSVEGLTEQKEIANMFASRFQIEPMHVNNHLINIQSHVCSPNSQVQFSCKQVTDAIREIKRGKSAGHDGLSIEHIVCAGEELHGKLCSLFNLCMKYAYLPDSLMKTITVPIVKNRTGDLSSASNYRPISLGTVLGKILERLIQPELLRNVKIDEAQFGFRPGLSTDSAILSLKHTVNYYLSRDTSVYACFLDLSRAFDLVNYNILWSKLRGTGVPGDVVSLLEYWYGNQTNNVRWGDTTSNDFRLECGVRQGGLTSPDLFNIYMNDLIGELRSTGVGCHLGGVSVNNLSYADDMVLLSPSIAGLRKLLSICEHYVKCHGLKYNILKTEMMVFKTGKGPDKVPEVWLDGSTVRVVTKFKYLGHILVEDLKDDQDIERERRALSVRCNMLARRFVKSSVEAKNTLFRAFCQCFYTSQLWVKYKRSSLGTLRVQYNDAYRILMKLPRFCSASAMFAEARVSDFFAVVRERIASFWERLRNSPNEILVVVSEDLYHSPIYRHWLDIHRGANRR